MKLRNLFRLVISILVPQLVGLIGRYFTTQSLTPWYESLTKPTFTPPNEVFGPVWFVLYLLMGIALYLVWSKGLENDEAKAAVIVFGIQLFFNLLWSIVFFGLQSPILGLLVIVLLWVGIFFTIRRFYPISKVAAWLLVPYLLWVTYAGAVNLGIVFLN